jgi:signal-transduction protein with cAMP-binding, CBS, and nucleotidyltransferase domain
MSTEVPRVNSSATVLEACTIMNKERFSGVVVFQEDKAVGMLTDRALLRNFVPLNKRPDEVKVHQVMAPLLRVDAGASPKEAALKIMQNRLTRLGVFDGEKFLGWVTITDLARETSKNKLLDALLSRDHPESDDFLCPNCRKAVLTKIQNREGEILRWECSNCRFIT